MIRKDSYEVPSIFKLLAKKGQVEEKMMYNTYNMGLGMVLAVDPGRCGQDNGSNQSSRRDTICGW